MRNASRDEVLSDVRARLSLIEGHSGFGAGDDFGATPAQPAAAAHAPAARSLDALYASVAAVYAETTPYAPKATPRPAAAMPAPRRNDSWGEDHDHAHRALVDPDLPFEDLAPPDWPAPRHALLEHEPPAPAPRPMAPVAVAAAAPASHDPAFELLTSRLASLEEKLETVLERVGTSAPSDDILDRMDELKGQYQRVADEIGRLEVIEDNLARLIDEVAERQPDNGLLADSVAQRLMREFNEQGLTPQAQAPADDERLAGLEHMLSTYVSSRQSQDGNTQHLLLAIRGIVETLDSRVGVIEHEIQQATAADPADAYDPHHAEASQAAPGIAAYADPVPQGHEGEEIDINDFDYDSEMAVAAEEEPEPEAGPAPTRRPALRQYQPAPAPQPKPHTDRESMIASARRAAKAAAGHDGNPLRAKMTEAVPGKIQPKSAVSNRAARFSLDKKSPRPVIIMAALALVLAGAGLFYLKMSRKPAGPKITIEKTVTPGEGETKKTADEAPAEDKQSMLLDELSDAPADLETGSTDGTTFGDPVPMPLSPTRASLDTEAAGDGGIAGAVDEDLPPEGIAPLAVRIKAANGDPTAQAQIANQLARGTIGAPDMAKAAEWYERAAIGGHAPSQYQLAALLERGSGVPQDAALARKWYGKAAVAGNVKAMHNLAVLTTTDDGGKRDYAAAAKLFHKAAGFGLSDSQFNLAILYENGLGVKRNTGEAYRWFALASEAGDKEAARRRDAVRRRLSPTMIKQMDGEIKAWSPSPVDDAANSLPSLQMEAAPAAPPEAPAATAVAAPKTSDVLLVQDLLRSLGYEVGAPGQLDARTSEAIASFEQRSKLPPTGEISDALIARLASLAG